MFGSATRNLQSRGPPRQQDQRDEMGLRQTISRGGFETRDEIGRCSHSSDSANRHPDPLN